MVMMTNLFGSGIVLPYQSIRTRSKSTALYRTSHAVPRTSTAVISHRARTGPYRSKSDVNKQHRMERRRRHLASNAARYVLGIRRGRFGPSRLRLPPCAWRKPSREAWIHKRRKTIADIVSRRDGTCAQMSVRFTVCEVSKS
jgi:hypothetical protein